MQTNLKLIIGLGNPDKTHQKTYHNIGFLFLDFLSEEMGEALGASCRPKTAASGKFNYLKVGRLNLVKPLTYMNESGIAVSQAIKYFKIKPEELLVAHDDSDIELGKYKLSFAKNSAGHKGVESVIRSLKTKNFWRLRIGARPGREWKPSRRRTKAMGLVLKSISKADSVKINLVFGDAAKELKII